MVKAHPEEPDSWWFAPRGPRTGDGWVSTLAGRVLGADDGQYEKVAVAYYRGVVAVLEAERERRGWSLRAFSNAAGVSLAVTSTALSGSAWPRWPTLTALVGAVDHDLQLGGDAGDVVVAALARIDAHPELSGRSVAPDVLVRPNTLYDLRKADRVPSSATVFALAAWLDTPIIATPSSTWRGA